MTEGNSGLVSWLWVSLPQSPLRTGPPHAPLKNVLWLPLADRKLSFLAAGSPNKLRVLSCGSRFCAISPFHPFSHAALMLLKPSRWALGENTRSQNEPE